MPTACSHAIQEIFRVWCHIPFGLTASRNMAPDPRYLPVFPEQAGVTNIISFQACASLPYMQFCNEFSTPGERSRSKKQKMRKQSPSFLKLYFTRGVTRILRYTGMCRSNGSLFHKKSLNMGSIFDKNIPKHGSVFFFFKSLQNFSDVCHYANTQNFAHDWPKFQEKSLKMSISVCQKTLEMGRGFRLHRLTHVQNWVPHVILRYMKQFCNGKKNTL